MRFEQIATIEVKPLASIIVQRVTTQPRLSLPSVVYNSACNFRQILKTEVLICIRLL